MKPDNTMRDFFILMGVMTIGAVLAGIFYWDSPQTEEAPLSSAEVMVELQHIRERLDRLTTSVENYQTKGTR